MLLVAVMLIAALGPAAATAAPSNVSPDATPISSCTTIESSGEYVLSSDVSDAPETGCLVVTADDVTVDGNGYAITSSEDAARGPAILATDAENVSVKNASLSGWQVGVAFDGVDRGSVTNVRVTTAAIVGITIEGSSQDIAVADNGVRDGTDGVRLAAASDVAVRDNAFSGLTGTAVDLRANASDATVQNNTVSDTSGIGVRVTGAQNVSVVGNDITNAADAGIGVDEAAVVAIEENRLEAISGVGIRVRSSPGTQTRNNVVTDARSGGIRYVESGDAVPSVEFVVVDRPAVAGILGFQGGFANEISRPFVIGQRSKDATHESVVANNTVKRSYNHGVIVQSTEEIVVSDNRVEQSDDGIHVTDSTDVTVRRNELRQNFDDGVAFERVSDSKIDANNATNNGDNGIYVVGNRNLLVENTGLSNGDDGIDLQNTSRSAVRSNVLTENADDGLFLRNANNGSIIGNTIRSNVDDGIHLRQSDGNVIRDNAVCRNGDEAIVEVASQNNDVTPGDCEPDD